MASGSGTCYLFGLDHIHKFNEDTYANTQYNKCQNYKISFTKIKIYKLKYTIYVIYFILRGRRSSLLLIYRDSELEQIFIEQKKFKKYSLKNNIKHCHHHREQKYFSLL